MLNPVYDESKTIPITEADRDRGFPPDWKKGDALIGRSCYGVPVRLKFLAWSDLDNACFIGEDEDGEICDDWSWRDFRAEYEEDE